MNRSKRFVIFLLVAALIGVTLAGHVMQATANSTAYSVIGTPEKKITLKRMNGTSYIQMTSGSNTVFQNIIFDGAGILSSYPYVRLNFDATFDNVTFKNTSTNSIGGAVLVTFGTITFKNSLFENNRALVGGHINIANEATVQIESSIFRNGHAVSKGGAILIQHPTASAYITSSTITENQAGDYGGGIVNNGTLTITETKVFNNRAGNGGADIGNLGSIQLTDSLQELMELFKDDKIVPKGWIDDYDYETGNYIPDIDPIIPNSLLKLAYEEATEQEEEPVTDDEEEQPAEQEPDESESSNEPGNDEDSDNENEEQENQEENPSEKDDDVQEEETDEDTEQPGDNDEQENGQDETEQVEQDDDKIEKDEGSQQEEKTETNNQNTSSTTSTSSNNSTTTNANTTDSSSTVNNYSYVDDHSTHTTHNNLPGTLETTSREPNTTMMEQVPVTQEQTVRIETGGSRGEGVIIKEDGQAITINVNVTVESEPKQDIGYDEIQTARLINSVEPVQSAEEKDTGVHWLDVIKLCLLFGIFVAVIRK